MTTARKQPQDRRPKQGADAAPEGIEPLIYTALDGTEYEVDGSLLVDVLTPGWLRKHRHMGDMDVTFELLEACASPELLEALDASWEELGKFSDVFNPYWRETLGASVGESKAS